MRLALLTILFCACLPAQDLSFFIYDNTGATADKPLGSSYQFPDTPQGSSSDLMLKAVNSTSYTIFLGTIYVGTQSGTAVLNNNFSITGLNESATVAPGAATYFIVHFIPAVTGNVVGYMQASYLVQKNGCIIGSTNSATQCPSNIAQVATLSGKAADAQLVLSYNANGNRVTLQPNNSTRLDFGNVSISSKQTITFTLTNETGAAIATPAVTIQNALYISSAFSLDLSVLPAALEPHASGTFTVTFAPAQTGLATATLLVGSNPYGIQGAGIVVTGIDALQIFYVDQNGVRTLPQAANPISLGQVVAGTSGTSTLTFTVANPSTSLSAVSIDTIATTGTGFGLTGLPNFPASIDPGKSISFKLTFAAGPAGVYNGTLNIGGRQFSLTAVSTASPVPTPTFKLSQSSLASQQQVDLTVQLASASPVPAIGTLTLQFVPSVSGVSDDSAILFTASGTRQLQMNVAAGDQTASYNGQSALTFQTGTTAGTLTFTMTFPNGAPYSQSFIVPPAAIHLTSASAVRKSPNLLVTVVGYDNTYSAGQLSFIFYDLSGKQINSNAIAVDSTSAFHQYFFNGNKAGGAFSVQASFPVSGDATQVGSVALTMTNSAGTTSSTQTFQ